MSAHTEIDVFWQRQINSTVLRAFQPTLPCSLFFPCLHLNARFQMSCFTVYSQLSPLVYNRHCLMSLNSNLFSISIFTLPAHLFVWGSLDLSTLHGPLPHLYYFGRPVPGICSNSSHPMGIGMSPLYPLSPSLVFSACLRLSYVHQHMYEAANVDSPAPTRGVQPTHFTGQSQLNHFQVVQPLEAGKPQLWFLQPVGQKQLGE